MLLRDGLSLHGIQRKAAPWAKQIRRVERGPFHLPSGAELEDVSAVQLNTLRLADGQMQPFQRAVQDSLGGRIQVQAAVWVVIETQRIIPLHEVQILPLIQHSECKRALDRFRHVCKAGKVEGIFLLNELDGHVAIRLDPCFWQVLGAAKDTVVPENAVVRKSERSIFRVAEEWVVVPIFSCVSLRGHTGMAHDDPAVCRNKQSFTYYRKPLLMMAGNHSIKVNRAEHEDALFNRMIVVPFTDPNVEESERIPELYQRFLDEAPYIVHEACMAYQELAARNWVPTRVPVPAEYAPQEGNQALLAAKAFVEDCISFETGSQVATAELYDAYLEYAEEEGYPQLNMTSFSRALSKMLKQAIPEAATVKRVNDENVRGYSNITLT